VFSIIAVLSSYLVFRSNETKPTATTDEYSAPSASESSPAKTFPVTIRRPAGPPTVDTGIVDASGNAVTVSCATCHATREPNFDNKTVADLNEFHNDLPFSHGTISCLSCHNSEDYSALKLADGSRVEFTDVMTLCAQCHGPQMRDYQHGTHGGMNGHWDLTRGPRTKNNCIDCHNPHSPQFPKMQPTFKPKDRFLEH
jgi:formate-dependent nitrite reductase cytochrome c552 subunit